MIITSYQNTPLHIVSSSQSLQRAIEQLLSYHPLYLGFDCEWRPNTKGQNKNKVSIIQIAHQKLIIIIRLNKLKNIHQAFISSGLLSLFSRTDILKGGVAIYSDKKKLFNDYNINVLGCVELNYLYHKHNIANSVLVFMGLKALSKAVLNVNMTYKLDDKSITLSDWETDSDLTTKQIHYAAEDALIGYKIFDKLIKDNIDSHKHHLIEHDTIHDMCFGIIDSDKFDAQTNKTCGHKSQQKQFKKKKNVSSYVKWDEKDCLMYDNCRILKPNGEFLSWCRRKTLDRYVNKGYAQRVDNDTIQLQFEPRNFNRKPQLEVVLGFKKNECSVCGETRKKLVRYFVVPQLYRQHMPSIYNEEAWRRHDVLPLCHDCHLKSQQFSELLKTELCTKYNIAHYRQLDGKLIEKQKLIRAVKPLINEHILRNIPKQKRVILLQNVADCLGIKYKLIQDINVDASNASAANLFRNLIEIDAKYGGNQAFVEKMKQLYLEDQQHNLNIGRNAAEKHSKTMIQTFENNMVQFIQLWRQQFVDNMKPKYLPQYWNVENTFFNLDRKQ